MTGLGENEITGVDDGRVVLQQLDSQARGSVKMHLLA
jgi:hypothetical protein